MPVNKVHIFCYEGVQLLDIAGPAQVLTTANSEGITTKYEVTFVGIEEGAITTASGLPIVLEALDPTKVSGTLILPGGPGARGIGLDEGARKLILEASLKARRICSICTGAFIAASIGLLDNRRAVTHWRSCSDLAREYPLIEVDGTPLFVRDGNIWTSAGVTAGIDLTLALLEEDHDATIAARVARRLVVYLRRTGGQKQFSDSLELQLAASGPYRKIIDEILANPQQQWTAEKMAELVGQSLRNFHRNFVKETGSTPAKAVECVRCSVAQNLLQTTNLSIEQVAEKTGFRIESTMRRALQRQFGLKPSLIRR